MDITYSLSQLSFTPEQKKAIDDVISLLDSKVSEYNIPEFFKTPNVEFLNKLTLAQLQELQQFKKLLHHLDDIHFKTMKSEEYKGINFYLKLIPEKIESIKFNLSILEESLRKKYAETSQDNETFLKLFNYQQFKEYYQDLTHPSKLTLELALEFRSGNMFEIVRKQIVGSLVQLESLAESSQIINLDQLKDSTRLYELFRAEFFEQVLLSCLGKETAFGKTVFSQMIRPSDEKLAKKFNLSISESALLTISMSPLGDSQINPKEKINFYELLFEATTNQQVYKKELMFNLTFNKLNYHIIAPVYFSYVRCQLINGQRSHR